MPGFNYRMTELQGAIGKVQLNKLNFMISENKKRYKILDSIISKKFCIRSELENHSGSYDTFIFSSDDIKVREKIIKILKKLNFGTKNLPDAMEWHCSYFWSHALSKENILNSLSTYNLLKKQIAIPVLLRKTLSEYEILAQTIINESFI